MVALFLIILGLIFGSFINVLVERIHAGKDFVRGRSHCDRCKHQLTITDLVPVFSWLALRGRCRYCAKPISVQHPAVEVLTGVVFALSYIFWPASLHAGGQIALFTGWLMASIGLLALAIYDLKWMLLLNKILYPTLFVALVSRAVYLLGYQPNKWHALFSWFASLLVASGFFAAIYFASRGKWIGFGDVRLGLVTGTLLATPAKSFLMILVASVLGTLVAVALVVRSQKSLKSKIAYGPFLILASFITLLFGQSIIDWYTRVFLG